MTLFTILFGAGIVLMTSRAESRGASAAIIHYRMTFILLVFGLLHAYLLWAGDVLVSYALCALVVFPFRKFVSQNAVDIGPGQCADRVHHFSVRRSVFGVYPTGRSG